MVTPNGKVQHNTLTALRTALRVVRHHRGLALTFLAATLAQGALQGAMVWSLREVLIALSRPGGVGRGVLVVGALAVFTVWLLRSGTVFAAQMLSARLAYRVELDWLTRVLEKLLTLSVRFFDKTSGGDLVMTAYTDAQRVRMITLQLGQLGLYVTQLAGLLIAAWVMSPKLTLIGILSVPLGAIPFYWLGQQLTEAARRERHQAVSLQDSYLQLSSGIRVIKVNRGESKVLARAREVSELLWRSVLRQTQAQGLARLLLEGISGFGLILILVIGGADVAAGRMPWQSLLGLLLAVMAVYTPVVGLQQLYGTVRLAIPNLERLEGVLEAVPEIQDRSAARRLLQGPATIELRNVSFAYGGQPALIGISAVIQRGETIGIVGPSGAGKSTLLSLLLRFSDPTDGAILFDGVDLRDLRHADVMQQSSIVPRGLSGGQKQRIAVAAALLKNAPMLFLDEATNSLDSVSEQKVQTAIERLLQHRTTFVIAHRFSTLRKADRIIVLDQGRLVGFDSRERLLATCHTYRKLWASQAALAPEAAPRRPEVVDV